MTLTLIGQLPSGKGQVRKTWQQGRLIHYPQKRFRVWRDDAGYQVVQQKARPSKPITHPVSLVCTYWPGDHRTRDVSGMLDAVFHLLVYSKMLKDDGLIYDVQWTRMPVSKRPKIHMELRQWEERGIT